MIQSFYSAASGLNAQQKNIDVMANNVANINTTGYKQQRLDFKDALNVRMRNPVENGDHMNLQLGTGAIPLQVNRIFHQGVALDTGRALDFMIEGRGFFTIRGYDAEGDEIELYTRDGTFYVDAEGQLTDSAGRFVLDTNGDIIVIEDPARTQVTQEGMFLFPDEEGNLVESDIRLRIVDFMNPVGLIVTGDNLFMESENSGDVEEMEIPNVVSGYLEGSNVDYALETTRLIRAQRAYQFASRALSVADQMAGLANSIRQ